jgi:predicted O-methyltransferase YrrM
MIETWTRPQELEKLGDLARNKECLEIGTWKGASAVAMAQAGAQVVTIDTHTGDPMTGPADTLSIFLANLAKYGVEDKVEYWVGTSEEVLPGLPEDSFDLVFIDATHTYEAVMTDSTLSYPLLRLGGMMVWHDYDESNRGHTLTGAIEDFTQAHNMKRIDLTMNLVTYAKLQQG